MSSPPLSVYVYFFVFLYELVWFEYVLGMFLSVCLICVSVSVRVSIVSECV